MKLSRDWVIVVAALIWGSYEIALGGARPSVLTLVSGLLLAPVVMKVDARHARRSESDDEKP